MSAFDTARDLRIPGVIVERVYIDPTAIGTRMKNMVKKMLRQGYTEGGWNSKSKRLALKLSECYHLQTISRSSYGLLIPERRSYSADVEKTILHFIDAAEAVELMNIKPNSHNPSREVEYIKQRMDYARDVIAGKGGFRHRWVTIYNDALVDQICAEFARTRSPGALEAVEDICSKLDDGKPIDITIAH